MGGPAPRAAGVLTGARLLGAGDDALHRAERKLKPLVRGPVIRLAGARRGRLGGVAFVGVTGSCGKTTTKDLIAAVLASRLTGTKSSDSNNGLYAVAQTILATHARSGYCVQELGADAPGSLDALIRLLGPRIGIVTNVGSDHYKAFRGPDAVAAEKGKLVAALPAHGVAVLNADDPRVHAMASRCAGRVLTFGLGPGAEIRAEAVTSAWPERLSFRVIHGGQSLAVRTRLCGRHWTPAVLAAIATGLALDVPLADAVAAVGSVEPRRGRMSPVEIGGVTFLRDDWKAPFWSLPAALELVREARASRKIVVIGTLSDYAGSTAPKYVAVARSALAVADHVFFVGGNAERCLRARRDAADGSLRAFPTVQAGADFLRRFLLPGDLVLLKGSIPADHLGRIALARRGEVACWRAACGRKRFCEDCRLLRVPAAPRPVLRGPARDALSRPQRAGGQAGGR